MDEKVLKLLALGLDSKNPEAIKAYNNLLKVAQGKGEEAEKAKTIINKVNSYRTKKAAHGAKLQYFKSLNHRCAENEEVVYYKKGGSVTCGCKKKEQGGEVPTAKCGSAVEKFKAARKALNGMQTPEKNKNNKTIIVTKEQVKKAKELNNQEKRDPKYITTDSMESKKNISTKKESPVLKFKTAKKILCGSKLKKHQEGGSLNGIPFMQQGTPKGGVKWKTSPRPDYIYNGKPVYPPTKYSPEIGNAEKHYLIDPYSGTLLDSGESNFMNDLENTGYPMGGYDASYELAKDWDTNSKKYRKNPILVSGFVSDLIGNRGFGRRIGSSWGNAYPHNPGWIKNPLFKKGYYYRY